MEEIKEKKPNQVLQMIFKIVVIVFALLFVLKIKNFRQGLFWVFSMLIIILAFFGRRANTFWTKKWQFNTVEDFSWAIAAILGVAFLLLKAFF